MLWAAVVVVVPRVKTCRALFWIYHESKFSRPNEHFCELSDTKFRWHEMGSVQAKIGSDLICLLCLTWCLDYYGCLFLCAGFFFLLLFRNHPPVVQLKAETNACSFPLSPSRALYTLPNYTHQFRQFAQFFYLMMKTISATDRIGIFLNNGEYIVDLGLWCHV